MSGRVQKFQNLAKRDSIKRAVERKTADFQRLFIEDLNMVKKQFDLLKRVPPADPVLPRYAGQATAALVLAKRVDHTWQALQVSHHLFSSCCAQASAVFSSAYCVSQRNTSQRAVHMTQVGPPYVLLLCD